MNTQPNFSTPVDSDVRADIAPVQPPHSLENLSTEPTPAQPSPRVFNSRRTTIAALGVVVGLGTLTALWWVSPALVELSTSPQSAQPLESEPVRAPGFEELSDYGYQEKIELIGTRSQVNTQSNVSVLGQTTSGFVDPQLFQLKPAESSQSFLQRLIPTVFAQESSESQEPTVHPFLFYTQRGTIVMGYDLATQDVFPVFDMNEHPFAQHEYSSIVSMLFLNRQKKIILSIQEYTSETDSKVGIYSYDLATKELTEIISHASDGSESQRWQGLSVSPDEKYLFQAYINTIDSTAFSEITQQNAAQYANGNYSVYMFYDLENDVLTQVPADRNWAGNLYSSWSPDSTQVYLHSPQSFVNGLEVYTLPVGGKTTTQLVRTAQDINDQVLTVKVLNEDRILFHTYKEKLGIYTKSDNSVVYLNPEGKEALQSLYDFKDTVYFGSIDRVNGVVTNHELHSFSLQTGSSSAVLDGDYFLLNLNGDLDHLLVYQLVLETSGSRIYDLDVRTGELLPLAELGAFLRYQD